MNVDQYRAIFLVATLALISVAAIPIINVTVSFQSGAEAFSELWVLGPNHTIAEYPLQMKVGEVGKIILGVRNHLKYPAYYLLKAKFRNETQPLPDALKSEPSSLPSFYEFRFFLENGETWETWFNFSVRDASFSQQSCVVKRIVVNGVPLSVNVTLLLNPIKKGFYYQFFFELWLYDSATQSFRYHGRFVSIWLNLIQ